MSDDATDQPTTAMAPIPIAAIPVRRRTRLHDLRAVRRYLSKVARDLEGEQIEFLKAAERIQLARAKVYTSQVLGELIRADELEGRIAELERLVMPRAI